MAEPARKRTTDERLDEIERLLREVLRQKRAAQRRAGRRAGTVAKRAADAEVAKYPPTRLQIAAARRRLGRTG